jgi:preprotein translocase subunit SecE
MVTKKSKKKVKKRRKPKGKKLSEKLEEKERAKEEEEAAAAAEAEADEDDDEDEDDDLASEPPPAYDEDEDEDEDDEEEDEEDDDVVDASFDEEDEDEPRDDEADEDDGADEDDEDEDDEDEDGEDEDDEEEWDEEDLAAAQMGHQRYVIAGFFGLWMLASFIIGKTFALIWSRLAAKDWFVETVPQLAAVPHEGDLFSRASISLVLGALIGGGIVVRYYTKPDVRQWADEVAEQLTHVKWPTRKDVGNNTVVVMVASALITAYLTLLDRFWSFVTNLIYTSGT